MGRSANVVLIAVAVAIGAFALVRAVTGHSPALYFTALGMALLIVAQLVHLRRRKDQDQAP